MVQILVLILGGEVKKFKRGEVDFPFKQGGSTDGCQRKTKEGKEG